VAGTGAASTQPADTTVVPPTAVIDGTPSLPATTEPVIPAPSPGPAPAPAPAPTSSWTRCAVEYGTCTFSGTHQVRYGLNDKWATRTATGAIACNNTVFGDPAPGVSKVCEVDTVSSAATQQLIEYYGDSTVWGYRSNTGGQVATPAPAAFAQALPNPTAYSVSNEGVSGSTACDLLNGTDGRHQPWSRQMAASKAKYVFVNHAINDQWKYDLATYKGCLRSLVQTAKQYGKQMIFETPNPTRDSGPGGLDTMVAAMKEVAAQENVPVVDQNKYLTGYLAGRSPYTICPDGLHPSDEVYVMKGKYAAGVFTGLFIQ
jgi:lysophospholipase L1-like esterase